MKKKYLALLATIAFTVTASAAMAGTAIVDSLQSQGLEVKAIADTQLNELRGAAVIVGQSQPSVLQGIKEHHVTYKGYGSYSDYRSYNYIGNGYNPGNFTITYNGSTLDVACDEWLADKTSSQNSRNRYNQKW